MNKQNAILIASATAAGLLIFASKRKPAFTWAPSDGIVAGINYELKAFGETFSGFRAMDSNDIVTNTKGKLVFELGPSAIGGIYFQLKRNDAIVWNYELVS